jgi:hypothetical protein
LHNEEEDDETNKSSNACILSLHYSSFPFPTNLFMNQTLCVSSYLGIIVVENKITSEYLPVTDV